MAAKIEIINFALAYLGEPPINAISDDNAAARAVVTIYDLTRDQVLRDHFWNFAIRRATLAQSANVPAFGFTRFFDLPADFLRLRSFNPSFHPPYRLEGRMIATDEDSAEIVYVSRDAPEADFDPTFVDALATRLAANLAMAITNSQDLEASLWKHYVFRVAEARSIDAQENPPTQLLAEEFIEARLGAAAAFRPFGDI